MFKRKVKTEKEQLVAAFKSEERWDGVMEFFGAWFILFVAIFSCSMVCGIIDYLFKNL